MEQQLLDKVQMILTAARKVVILTHMSPDGDAMGSALGVKHLLSAFPIPLERLSVIVPNSFPGFLAWLPGADEIVVYENDTVNANALLDEADTIICTDFNEPKRIGALGDRLLEVLAANAVSLLVLDHHIVVPERTLPEAPEVVKIIDSGASSACELVYRTISPLTSHRSPITLDAATCIYTGLMTDTGNFAFNSNKPEIYRIIAELVAMGVDKDAVYDHIFNAWSDGRMRLVGYCLYQKMRLFPDVHTSLIAISGKELYKFNFKAGDAEGIVNMPLQIKDVYYSVFMREDKVTDAEKPFANGSKKKIKISMRSQGDRPVNDFCREIFGGGGHKNASGGEFYGSLEDAVKLFLTQYEKYFQVG